MHPPGSGGFLPGSMRRAPLDFHHQAGDFIPERGLPPWGAVPGYTVGARDFGPSDAWGGAGLGRALRFVRARALETLHEGGFGGGYCGGGGDGFAGGVV